mgnify:FL=1
MDEYDRDLNLIRTENNPNGSFDSLYVCGQYECHMTSENYADGGTNQNNHFDLVDLVAASAMVDFFNKTVDKNGQIVGLGKIYEYRFGQHTNNAKAEIVPKDISELSEKMKQMLLFSAFVVTRVYGQYLLNKSKSQDFYNNVEMVRRLFDHNEIIGRNNKYSNVIEASSPASVYLYCREYIRLAYDIAKNGYNWQDNIENNAYKLFSKNYTGALLEICDAIDGYADENAEHLTTIIDSFINSKQEIYDGETPKKTINSVGGALGAIFGIGKGGLPLNKISKVYHGNNATPPEARFMDYIHEAYKACQGV